MNKRGNLKKSASFLLILFIVFGVLVHGNTSISHAKDVNVSITYFEIKDAQGDAQENFKDNEKMMLYYKWKITNGSEELHEGDTITFDLPAEYDLSKTDKTFDVLNNGVKIGTATVTPTGTSGGNITITFTNYVENKQNIIGEARIIGKWNKADYPVTQDNQEFTVNSNGKSDSLKISPYKVNYNRIIYKTTAQDLETYVENGVVVARFVNWLIRVNERQSNLTNIKLHDRLRVTGSYSLDGMEYEEGSFVMYPLTYAPNGKDFVKGSAVDINDKVKLSADKKSFTYDLGNIGTDMYEIDYKTKYVMGQQIENTITLTGEENGNTVKNQSWGKYLSAENGGTGGENETRDIKVKKEWIGLEQSSIKAVLYANGAKVAEQELKAPDWKYTFKDLRKYDKNTGDEIIYTVDEEVVPTGYERTITGSPEDGFTITNKQKTIDIKDEKTWDDNNNAENKRPVSITIILYANGHPIQNPEVKPDANGKWTYSIEGLAEYDDQGNKIIYTIKEEPVPGYTSQVNGYDIVNRKKPNPVTPPDNTNPGTTNPGTTNPPKPGDDSNADNPGKDNQDKDNGSKDKDKPSDKGKDSDNQKNNKKHNNNNIKNSKNKKNKRNRNSIIDNESKNIKSSQLGRNIPRTGDTIYSLIYLLMIGLSGTVLVLVRLLKRKN